MFLISVGAKTPTSTAMMAITTISSTKEKPLLQTKSTCASFERTMSTLLQAGMPMIDALEISASTMKNVLYYDALEKVKSGVSLGLPLSNQLRTSGLFPPMVVHMVGIGEETGNVEEMLTNSVVYLKKKLKSRHRLLLR